MCPERLQAGESLPYRGGLHRKLRQSQLGAAHHDEGPVRQLRRPEDDRRGWDQSAEDPHAQDPTSLLHTKEIHLREAHPGQGGEVLPQEQHGPGTHRAARDNVTRRDFHQRHPRDTNLS